MYKRQQLSGGEQQRVSIARALAKNPKILLCDEPTGALDYQTGKSILKLLQDTCHKKGKTVVVITHNLAIAPMADRVIEMKNGKISNITINEHPQPVETIESVSYTHLGFDGKVKEGELIVNKKIAKKTVKVFYALYQKRYRIERMRLIDDYGANDEKSMAANNTSAFNYRVISGTTKLSNHSYGMAIDINPRINPWVKGNKVSPANGKVYKQRKTSKCKGKYKRYMIHKNDTAYKIFKKYGFSWGGEWRSSKDYQHFDCLLYTSEKVYAFTKSLRDALDE